jgi:hypothetical protein
MLTMLQTKPHPTPVENQIAANDEEAKKPSEPPMVSSADRIWVEIEMTPKSPAPKSVGKKTAETKTASTTSTKSNSSDGDLGDSQSEIRKARL